MSKIEKKKVEDFLKDYIKKEYIRLLSHYRIFQCSLYQRIMERSEYCRTIDNLRKSHKCSGAPVDIWVRYFTITPLLYK